MSRKPDGAEPRSERITIRVTPAGRALLQRSLRDSEDESAFIRTAIANECDRRTIRRATTKGRS